MVTTGRITDRGAPSDCGVVSGRGVVAGWRWTRTWLTVSLGIGALAATARVFLADSFAHRVAGVIIAVVGGGAAWTVERSAAIDAFYERHT